MPIRPVLLVPDARLKQPCAPVEIFDDNLRRLLTDLEDTRLSNAGCVGIAAPQIAAMQRVAIVDTSQHPKYGAQSLGHLVLINPRIIEQDGERLGREGCLSLPDFTANVRRAMQVSVAFQDENGIAREVTATDFEAVVLQHEIDHLDGVLYVEKFEPETLSWIVEGVDEEGEEVHILEKTTPEEIIATYKSKRLPPDLAVPDMLRERVEGKIAR